MQRDINSIEDILSAANEIQDFLGNIDQQAFLNDRLRFSAVIHKLLIIGEACTRFSKEFRAKYPEIPWRQIIGMRNILIHAYDDIILQEVWYAATVSTPQLVQLLEQILPQEQD